MVTTLVFYGDQHPYGHPPDGTLSSAKKIQLADIVAWHRKIWRPDQATFIVVGDITAAQVTSLLAQIIRRLGRPPTLPLPVASTARGLAQWRAHVRRRSFRRSAGHHVVRAFGAPGERPVLSQARDAQHRARRVVHLAAQPKPARRPRMDVRSALALQLAARRGDVRGARRDPRQRDRRGAG